MPDRGQRFSGCAHTPECPLPLDARLESAPCPPPASQWRFVCPIKAARHSHKPLPTLQKNRPAAQQKNPLVRTHFNNAHPAAIRSSTRRRIKVMLRFKRPEYPKNLSTNLLRGHDAASRNFKTARAGKMPFPVSVIQRVDANAPTFRG